MNSLRDEIKEKLEWFMATSLAISGSTNDVDIVDKDLTRLLSQALTRILELVEKDKGGLNAER